MKGFGKDHKGFTLVELIVVVLVIGILGTGIGISYSVVSNAKANACAERVSKLLDRTRLETMSRVGGRVRMEICLRDDSYYGVIYLKEADGITERALEEVELGVRGLTLTAYNGSAEVLRVTEGHPLEIRFIKGSGAFDFTSTIPFTCLRIEGSNTREVYIYSETGRNTIGK